MVSVFFFYKRVVKIRPQHEGDKEAVLLALCSRSFKSKVIIFRYKGVTCESYLKRCLFFLMNSLYNLPCSGTKLEAHRLKILFGLLGLQAAELHGNLTQAQRLDVFTYLILFH